VGAFADSVATWRSIGASVVPIIPGTKRPAVKWTRFRKEQADRDVLELVHRFPDYDIAVVLGGADGIVDIETDSADGEAELLACGLALPRTATYRSRRGSHRLYRSTVELQTCDLAPDVEVRATGAISVVPNSRGREWLIGGPEDIAPLPEEWVRALRATRAGAPMRLTGPALIAIERAGVDEGLRNCTLAALVGRWLTQLRPAREIRGDALAWARRCTPPLSDDEVLTVVESVVRSRQRARSPERDALLLARTRGIRQPAAAVFVALVALWGELGLGDPVLFAPHRKIMDYAGISFDGVRSSLDTLVRAGLIETSRGRDPWGRSVTIVRFRVPIRGMAPSGA